MSSQSVYWNHEISEMHETSDKNRGKVILFFYVTLHIDLSYNSQSAYNAESITVKPYTISHYYIGPT